MGHETWNEPKGEEGEERRGREQGAAQPRLELSRVGTEGGNGERPAGDAGTFRRAAPVGTQNSSGTTEHLATMLYHYTYNSKTGIKAVVAVQGQHGGSAGPHAGTDSVPECRLAACALYQVLRAKAQRPPNIW